MSSTARTASSAQPARTKSAFVKRVSSELTSKTLGAGAKAGMSSSSSSMWGRMELFDGKKIRRLMNDDEKFDAFLSAEFDRLDADDNGRLSLAELKPALLRLGQLLGMPPPGTRRAMDDLVEGLFASFMSPDLSHEIARGAFVAVCKDVLRGASHALEADPLSVLVCDGSMLAALCGDTDELEALLNDLFVRLDTDGSGRISRSELKPALAMLGLLAEGEADGSSSTGLSHGARACGVFPADAIVDRVMSTYGCGDETSSELTRASFLSLMADVLKGVAAQLEQEPLYLPQNVTLLNGAYARKLVRDPSLFQSLVDGMFAEWDDTGKGFLSCSDAINGFKRLGRAYGLPPADSPDALQVYTSLFVSADLDMSGFVDKLEFRSLMHSLFTGMALQLEQRPVVVPAAAVRAADRLSDAQVFDGRRVLQLMQADGGQRVEDFLATKFDEMDVNDDGCLSRVELQPALLRLAGMMGLLSNAGTCEEVDELVEGVCQAVVPADVEELDKKQFVAVMMRSLQGVGKALQDDPLRLLVMDGARMREVTGDKEQFENLIGRLFDSLDTDGRGQLSANELKPAIHKLADNMGLPRDGSRPGLDGMVAQLILRYGCGHPMLNRDQFTALMQALVEDTAGQLEMKPAVVKQRGRVLNGARMRKILKDDKLFQKVCADSFVLWDTAKNGRLSRADVCAGLSRSGVQWGLPPHPAQNAGAVYDSFLNKVWIGGSRCVERNEFDEFLRSLLKVVAQNLKENPVVM